MKKISYIVNIIFSIYFVVFVLLVFNLYIIITLIVDDASTYPVQQRPLFIVLQLVLSLFLQQINVILTLLIF